MNMNMKAVALVGPWTLIKVPLRCMEGEGHNFEDYDSNHESLSPLYMSHSQMLGKFEYGLPAKF